MLRLTRRSCSGVLKSFSELAVSENVDRKLVSLLKVPCRTKTNDPNLSALFTPVPVKPTPDDISVGAELSGQLNKSDLVKVLNSFYQKKEVKLLATEHGLDSKLRHYFWYANDVHMRLTIWLRFRLPTTSSVH